MKIELFEYKTITFQHFGLTHPFWTIHLDTLIYTWVGMAMLFLVSIIGYFFFRRDTNKISVAYEEVLMFFVNLGKESLGVFHYPYFSFTTTLFLFTVSSCFVGLIPFLDEATKDLNTTLALGMISFFYVQYQKASHEGIAAYLYEFTQPFFILIPINIIGELAKIVSMAFRLFGNILGGAIIFSMLIQAVDAYKQYFLGYMLAVLLLALVLSRVARLSRNSALCSVRDIGLSMLFIITWIQFFFGVFEGLIQGFVLCMLTMTYLSMSFQTHRESATIPSKECS